MTAPAPSAEQSHLAPPEMPDPTRDPDGFKLWLEGRHQALRQDSRQHTDEVARTATSAVRADQIIEAFLNLHPQYRSVEWIARQVYANVLDEQKIQALPEPSACAPYHKLVAERMVELQKEINAAGGTEGPRRGERREAAAEGGGSAEGAPDGVPAQIGADVNTDTSGADVGRVAGVAGASTHASSSGNRPGGDPPRERVSLVDQMKKNQLSSPFFNRQPR